MPGNSNLHDSSRNKQDEFYTNLQLVEDELKHYCAHFKGKRVLCNCDDPYESNFFKYFAMSFNSLGLKSLTATCYATSPVVYTQLDLFGEDKQTDLLRPNGLRGSGNVSAVRREQIRLSNKRGRQPYKIVINEVTDVNGDGRIDLADVEWLIKNKKNVLTKLKGDGDFRSPECVALLDEADIVVTNPPFSLFREYMSLLMEHGKQFLIVGNMNAVTYREIFPLIRDNKVWLGNKSGHFWFKVPDSYEEKATDFKIDESRQKMSPQNAANLTDEQLQEHPFFLDFANPEMHTSSNGLIVASNYLYRAEMLAYAIPAESYAVGANPLPGLNAHTNAITGAVAPSCNHNMATEYTFGQDDLPQNGDKPKDRHRDWQHSTFVQRSYKRVHQLFKRITQLVKETSNE